jgi:2-dehydropantoate 2-reductase
MVAPFEGLGSRGSDDRLNAGPIRNSYLNFDGMVNGGMAAGRSVCQAGRMRFVVFGAGAIGGVVGGRLLEHGYEVAVIARGAHGDAITKSGLQVDDPRGSITVHPSQVADHPSGIEWSDDDMVLLCVKSQDTVASLSTLFAEAPPTVPVACLQNGVANEQSALRWFSHVYGVTVMCPAARLEPGRVVAYSSPTTALLDIGRYPEGDDEICRSISDSFNASSMHSIVRPDIMRWKYAKLVLMNLANAVDALCGPEARGGRLAKIIHREGIEVLRVAGIDFASDEEDRMRRGNLLNLQEVPGQPWSGSSSWQSLARSAGTIETDYLNGEIVLLGRLHGVTTPANEQVQRLAELAAREEWPPASLTEDQVLDLIH